MSWINSRVRQMIGIVTLAAASVCADGSDRHVETEGCGRVTTRWVGTNSEGATAHEVLCSTQRPCFVEVVDQTSTFATGAQEKLGGCTQAGAAGVVDQPVPAGSATANDQPRESSALDKPRAVVVTLGNTRDETQGDLVGVYINADALEQMLPMLEEQVGDDGKGVVVLRVDSGGGTLREIQKISDVLHNKYKKKFRTVGWIDSAIAAAAMCTLCLEEIYFTDTGHFGACASWSMNHILLAEPETDSWLVRMDKISALGGYNPLIMRSMQVTQPLSATRLPNGEIKFFPDETSGEFIVNRKNDILVFNAQSALKVGFSKGTASTLDELTKVMGYTELQWVGEDTPGSLYPISKAEKWNIAYRKQAKIDDDRTQEYFASYQLNMQAAARETTGEGRVKLVGRARQALEKIKAMVRNNPNFIMFSLNMPNEEEYKKFLAEQEKIIRDMMP